MSSSRMGREAVALLSGLLVASGSASGQEVRHEDREYGAQGAAELGASIAAEGTMIVAGATGDSFSGVPAKAFAIDALTGEVRFELAPLDPDEEHGFGAAVALRGDYIVVGAPLDNELGSQSGSAYVYSSATGEFLYKITAQDAVAGQHFGSSLAITGTTLLVGSPGANVGGRAAGAVYVFDLVLGLQGGKLVAADADAGDQFGASVAVSDNIVVIGARTDDQKAQDAGAAYVFALDTQQQVRKFTAFDGAAEDSLGASVAVEGNVAVAGAPGAGGGAAYVFNVSTGGLVTKTASQHPSAIGSYGAAVAMGPALVAVGAPLEDDLDGNSEHGVTYVYERATGDLLAELRAKSTDSLFMGGSLAVDGATVYTGAPYAHDQLYYAGAVYSFGFGPRVHLLEGSRVVDAGSPPVQLRVVADRVDSYRWTRDGIELQDGPLYSGAGTATLTVTPTDETEGEYAVVLGSEYGDVECPALAIGIRGGASCLADADGNGVIDTRDVLTFLNAWNAGCP